MKIYKRMCGIFTLLNDRNVHTMSFIEEQFLKGRGRGPEFSKLEKIDIEAIIGFHRLAINGLNEDSNQPLVIGDVTLVCNGEIYNYKELYDMMDIEPTTNSDCEVIIHLYNMYGIEQTLQMLDGVFSFVLYYNNVENMESKIFVARDPYGVRPLYILSPSANYIEIQEKKLQRVYAFASEIKVIEKFIKQDYTIQHFPPGTYSSFHLSSKINAAWIQDVSNKLYHCPGFNSSMFYNESYLFEDIMHGIKTHLINAVNKRVLITERPVACLLSGGLDSSLITALVNEIHKETLPDKKLETYSIGLAGSEDLKYARIVADHLKTKHVEIVLTESDFLDAIPEVIRTIESYDTTTVRASIGNYLLGKYISKNSDAKVIFNGDGSDELCGGYLYMHKAPDAIEMDRECRRLLRDIHAFDVLRSDKCISSHGLEPRTPFLDRSWVQYYLGIHPKIRFHANPDNRTCEKYLLRSAFSTTYYENNEGYSLLPDSILWRKKEAFSDGVSKMNRSLYQIIQDHVKTLDPTNFDIDPNNYPEEVRPDTLEKKYYRHIFESFYPNLGNIVPYFWMPRYIEASDASARTLSIYETQ